MFAALEERGGFRAALRFGARQRMLPLTPAARHALIKGLSESVEMRTRLEVRCRRHASRTQGAEQPRLIDGSFIENVTHMDQTDEALVEALCDAQWAVRDVAVRSMPTIVATSSATYVRDALLGEVRSIRRAKCSASACRARARARGRAHLRAPTVSCARRRHERATPPPPPVPPPANRPTRAPPLLRVASCAGALAALWARGDG